MKWLNKLSSLTVALLEWIREKPRRGFVFVAIPLAVAGMACDCSSGMICGGGSSVPAPPSGSTLTDHWNNPIGLLAWDSGTYDMRLVGNAYYTDQTGASYPYFQKKFEIRLEEICNGGSQIDYDQFTYVPYTTNSYDVEGTGGYATGLFDCLLGQAIWGYGYWWANSYSTPDFIHEDFIMHCHMFKSGPTGTDICGQWGV